MKLWKKHAHDCNSVEEFTGGISAPRGAAKSRRGMPDNAGSVIGASAVHMWQRWTFTGRHLFVRVLSAAAINQLYSNQTAT